MAKGFKINGTDFDDLFEPVRDGFGSVTFTGLSPECTYMAKTGDSPNPNADGYYKYNGTAYSAHQKDYKVPKSLTYSGTWGTQNESTAVNTSGITFTVTYQDGTTDTVTPSVSPSSWAANSGNQTATFSYTYHGVTVSTTKNCNMTYSYTTASGGNGSVSGSGTYVYNASSAQTKSISYSPNNGYQYSSWSCSGGSSCSASETTLTISAGCHGNITATCSFSAIVYTITMATNNSTYGTTSINTATYTISGSAQTRALSHSVTNSNIYQFNSWSTGKGSISGSTLTIPAGTYGNFTVTGNFGLKTFTITVQSGGNGTVSGPTTYTYSSSAQTKTIGYSANSGYEFSSWSVSGPTSGTASASGTTLTIGAGAYGNITITGSFSIVTYTITMATNNSKYGTTSIDTSTYTISGSAQTRTISASTVSGSRGYQFDSWTTGKGTASGSTLTIPAGTYGNFTVTGNFSPKTYTITVVSAGHGTVSGSTTYQYDYYAYQGSVLLGCTPDTGYIFDSWSTSGGGGYGIQQISGNWYLYLNAGTYGDITVTGYFALIVPTSLSISGDWSNTQYTSLPVDYTGLTFTCTYSDGTTATVTPSRCNPTTWDNYNGVQTCMFYYTENGDTVGTYSSVNVYKLSVRLNKFSVDTTATTLSFT